MERKPCAPRSIWPRRISIFVIRLCTGLFMKDTTGREISGAFIQRMIGRMVLKIPLKESRIPSVRSSLKIIVRCTDWYINELGIYHPQQIEFARLNITYTVLSKRRLLQLVQEKHVSGWDDPRMPTIVGFRRRGYTSESIKMFCDKIGVSKKDSIIDVAMLEWSIREDLNKHAQRAMAVLHPIKVIITNYPEE